MAEKNSLWKNIREKAEQNRRTGAKPRKPTTEMLRQERKIKAKKAEGGYVKQYDEGSFVTEDGVNPPEGTPTNYVAYGKPFEVVYKRTPLEKMHDEEYQKRLAAQQAQQNNWYPGLEYDPTEMQNRARMAARDKVSEFIIEDRKTKNKTRGDYDNRQEFLKSMTPEERQFIEQSNLSGYTGIDAGSQFKMAASKLLKDPLNLYGFRKNSRASKNLFNDPDVTQEEYNNASRLGLLAPLTVPLNTGKAIITGDNIGSALSGEATRPLYLAHERPMGMEDVAGANTISDIALDPLNFVGIGAAPAMRAGTTQLRALSPTIDKAANVINKVGNSAATKLVDAGNTIKGKTLQAGNAIINNETVQALTFQDKFKLAKQQKAAKAAEQAAMQNLDSFMMDEVYPFETSMADKQDIFNTYIREKNEGNLFINNGKISVKDKSLEKNPHPIADVNKRVDEYEQELSTFSKEGDTVIKTITPGTEGFTKTGSGTITNFRTGQKIEAKVDPAKRTIEYSPTNNGGVNAKFTDRSTPEVNTEYIDNLKDNKNFAEESVPGLKIFGSSVGVTEGGLPHLTGDIDGLITQSNYEKNVKSKYGFIQDKGAAKVHDFGKTGTEEGHIDFNIIHEDANGNVKVVFHPAGNGERSLELELFRQVDPEGFFKAAKEAVKNKGVIKVPYKAQELLDRVDPAVKTVMDAYESQKAKHANKIDAYINYGNTDVVAKAQNQYVKSIVGEKGNVGHQFNANYFSNENENLRLLNEIEFIGDANLVARDPKRMQLALNDYYINNSILSRSVDSEHSLVNNNINKIEDSITTWFPGANGGNVNGEGLNTVLLGDPHHSGNIMSHTQLGLKHNTSSPFEYVKNIKRQTDGNYVFTEDELGAIKGLMAKHFGNEVSENISNIKESRDLLKAKNYQPPQTGLNLSKAPPFNRPDKLFNDITKELGIRAVSLKGTNEYGNSWYTSALGDLDKAIDAIAYSFNNQGVKPKGFRMRQNASQQALANIYQGKEIERVNDFKRISNLLDNGLSKVKARQANLREQLFTTQKSIDDLKSKFMAKENTEHQILLEKQRTIQNEINTNWQKQTELTTRINNIEALRPAVFVAVAAVPVIGFGIDAAFSDNPTFESDTNKTYLDTLFDDLSNSIPDLPGMLPDNPPKKAYGGYYPTQGPGKALFKGYAEGGYNNPYQQYATGSFVGEDDGKKSGFETLTESQKALLQKGNNLDKVKGWYEQNPEVMQNFQSFMNEHNADNYLNLYNTEQKNFDTANKNNAEWHKQWYAKRAQLPQFEEVATQRQNAYSNLDSAKLIDPVNYAFKYWAANNASAFKDKNLPPETFYFPTDKLYGHQSDTDNEINVNAKLFNEGNYNVNNKLYNQTLSHETNHKTEDMFPQEGTVNHLNKSSWKNRDIIKDPIQNILTYDDILKDTRTNGGSDVYQYQPTEVRSRLDIWRQYNNIDALKNYSDEEIRGIMQKNMEDPNVPRNVKELYKTIQETPNKLNYLNNSYVSNDKQGSQNYTQKAATGGYTNPYNQYQDDPYLQYADGGYMYGKGGWKKFGNTMADIGLGIGDVALGAIGSATGIKSLQDTIGTDQYHNDDFDTGANFVGKLAGTALKFIPVTAPFAAAAGVVGGVANAAIGIDRKNYDPSKHQRDLDKAGDIVNFAGDVGTMFIDPTKAANAGAAASKGLKAGETATKGIEAAKIADTAVKAGEAVNTAATALDTGATVVDATKSIVDAGNTIGTLAAAAAPTIDVAKNVGQVAAAATPAVNTLATAATAAKPVVDSANKLSSGLKYGEGYYDAVDVANKISKYGNVAQTALSVGQPIMQQQQQKQQKQLSESTVGTEPMYPKPDANTAYAGITTPTFNTGTPQIGGDINTYNPVFSQGGNITNNSLNLRNTMRYKRFAQGGFNHNGLNLIPTDAAYHKNSANGGIPIAEDALAEGGEVIMDTPDGGKYVVPHNVDGAESIKDFTYSKGGKYKELDRSMADGLRADLKKYMMGGLATNPKFRDERRRPFDTLSDNTIEEQIMPFWQEKSETARKMSGINQQQATLEDLKKTTMEEYVTAYGGKLPNKYKGKINMPKRANGGYVHNQMTQPMLAEGGPIYGDPASEYTYAMGGMYGDPYARGGQIDYTNDMYASGGPMVGNAQQPFNGPAAQNRGGMLMTYPDGGMMPPQDQQIMQQQMMQQQQMQQAPQQQMPQQGGQDQMAQILQRVEQAIMSGAKPEQIMDQLVKKVGMQPEEAQQVIQMAMQDVQQQQQPQQQMAPPQQMMAARGGKMYYRGGPDGPPYDLPGMADMNSSEYNSINSYLTNLNTPNFVDNQGNASSILSRMSNKKPLNLTGWNTPNQSIPGPYNPNRPEHITTLDRLKQNYFDTSNSYNPNPTLPNNELGSMAPTSSSRPEPMPYDDEIDYTQIPNTTPVKLTGWKPAKPADKIPGPIGPNTIGPNNITTEAEAIAQGWKPEQLTTKTPPPTKNGLSTSDWVDLGAGALSLAGSIDQWAKGNKYDRVKYPKPKPTTLDPTTAIALANLTSREAQATADYNTKQNAPTSGSYIANMRANAVGFGRDRSRTASGIKTQYDINNAGILNQFEQIGNTLDVEAMRDEAANKGQAATNQTNALYNAGANLAGMRKDYKANQINETIAKNLGTNNWEYDQATETFKFKNPNGQMISVPAATVLGTNPTNLSTGQMQQKGTPQFQNNFDAALQTSLRNSFRKKP